MLADCHLHGVPGMELGKADWSLTDLWHTTTWNLRPIGVTLMRHKVSRAIDGNYAHRVSSLSMECDICVHNQQFHLRCLCLYSRVFVLSRYRFHVRWTSGVLALDYRPTSTHSHLGLGESTARNPIWASWWRRMWQVVSKLSSHNIHFIVFSSLKHEHFNALVSPDHAWYVIHLIPQGGWTSTGCN